MRLKPRDGVCWGVKSRVVPFPSAFSPTLMKGADPPLAVVGIAVAGPSMSTRYDAGALLTMAMVLRPSLNVSDSSPESSALSIKTLSLLRATGISVGYPGVSGRRIGSVARPRGSSVEVSRVDVVALAFFLFFCSLDGDEHGRSEVDGVQREWVFVRLPD